MEVREFMVSYNTPNPDGADGVRTLLMHDTLQKPLNVTGLGDIVNVVPTSELTTQQEIEELDTQGLQITPDGGNGLIIVHRPYF